jgi:hypothetical protein
MESTLNVKLMGGIVVVLVAIKYGLLPVLEWQNQTIDELYQVERRNVKAENLLNNKDQVFMRLAKLSNQYKSETQTYPKFDAQIVFRLESQVLFDILIQQNNLRKTQFFWHDSEDKQVFGNLYKAKFNIDFTGYLKDFALLQTKLVNANKQFKILNMSTSILNQTQKSIGIVDATLTVDAYYWRGEAQ